MAIENERKFLVSGHGYLDRAVRQERIVQGYLSVDPDRTVRVRIKGECGYLTVKGRGDAQGVSRGEWEYVIPLTDAQELLSLCHPGALDKTRYCIPVGRHLFEVDVFRGDNQGLVLAEVELDDPAEPFERPDWLAREVTGEVRYYNAALSRHPYKDWTDRERDASEPRG